MNPMTDIEEMITTGQALTMASEIGSPVSRSAITQAAKRWAESGSETGIKGATKLGSAAWVFPREAFIFWLKNHRTWGK